MDYKQQTENIAVIDSAYVPPKRPLPLTSNIEIRRTRKTLLIIFDVLLALTVISLVWSTFLFVNGNSTVNDYRNPTVDDYRNPRMGQAIYGIFLYGLGIFAASRYSSTGLRIFGWLGIFQLAFLCVIILFYAVVIFVDILDVYEYNRSKPSIYLTKDKPFFWSVIILIIVCGMFAFLWYIVKLAFKLAQLIIAYHHTTTQQV